LSSSCIELLAHYNLEHGIFAKRGRSGPIELAENLSTLQELLSPDRLKREVHDLESEIQSKHSKDYFKDVSTRGMAELWASHVQAKVLLGNQLHPPRGSEGRSNGSEAHVRFQLLDGALKTLVPMHSEIKKMAVIRSAFLHEICGTLITIFEWYSFMGPAIAEFLFQVHLNGGYEALQSQAPEFADLADHIVQFVISCRPVETDSNQRKRRKKKIHISEGPHLHERLGPSRAENGLSSVSSDFYGLRKIGKGTSV
jgi:hypothetical protein